MAIKGSGIKIGQIKQSHFSQNLEKIKKDKEIKFRGIYRHEI